MLLKNGRNSKILVCAPSNAAIDEISARLAVQGIYNCDLKKDKCKFLRFGLYDRKDKEKKYLETYNGKILEKYSLEYISDQKYKKDIENITERLENLRRQLNNLNKEKLKEKDNVKLNNLIGTIKNTEVSISNNLKLLSDRKYQKNLFEQEILTTTPILCTTLNNSGNERLKRARLSFEYLIVDEASQCVEPLSLIPLYHDVKKLILVGDHMQLPATVFYPKASKILYNRSLFERLIDNKYPRFILTVQYRMQKNISEFISKTFYDNKLTNDEKHVDKINNELIYDIIKIGNNFSFFDVHYGEEVLEEEKKSYVNKNEINFCFSLIKNIIHEIKNKIDFFQKEKDKKIKEKE
jgi:senataxin